MGKNKYESKIAWVFSCSPYPHTLIHLSLESPTSIPPGAAKKCGLPRCIRERDGRRGAAIHWGWGGAGALRRRGLMRFLGCQTVFTRILVEFPMMFERFQWFSMVVQRVLGRKQKYTHHKMYKGVSRWGIWVEIAQVHLRKRFVSTSSKGCARIFALQSTLHNRKATLTKCNGFTLVCCNKALSGVTLWLLVESSTWSGITPCGFTMFDCFNI